jgi:hypothetical protein
METFEGASSAHDDPEAMGLDFVTTAVAEVKAHHMVFAPLLNTSIASRPRVLVVCVSWVAADANTKTSEVFEVLAAWATAETKTSKSKVRFIASSIVCRRR